MYIRFSSPYTKISNESLYDSRSVIVRSILESKAMNWVSDPIFYRSDAVSRSHIFRTVIRSQIRNHIGS